MTNITKRNHVISVFPSEQQPGSYRWSITALSTTSVTQSPYAFATALGATMSAECWLRVIVERGSE
ncbi:hypothetical protein MKK64_10160 [Methylobacterium sp. E-025]|jgi:hypothetical protein|uniref:hypothetical protein n=1 Tax=Methylobacterium sp. E-025 TaxID=2836561 RepID=UPI001FB8D008|nr:hypothetical protein [Methylobacterium sp. E-025]MCJ2111555.1 hypothetical protein [Methylobacterium sp. E-025]